MRFSEGFRYQIEISYGKRLHYISNKISAKYELQRILVSRFLCGAKLSGHFAKKNDAHIFCLFGACKLHLAKIRASSGPSTAGVPSQANLHIACRAGILDWDTSK